MIVFEVFQLYITIVIRKSNKTTNDSVLLFSLGASSTCGKKTRTKSLQVKNIRSCILFCSFTVLHFYYQNLVDTALLRVYFPTRIFKSLVLLRSNPL